jgi:hypothetical protein
MQAASNVADPPHLVELGRHRRRLCLDAPNHVCVKCRFARMGCLPSLLNIRRRRPCKLAGRLAGSPIACICRQGSSIIAWHRCCAHHGKGRSRLGRCGGARDRRRCRDVPLAFLCAHCAKDAPSYLSTYIDLEIGPSTARKTSKKGPAGPFLLVCLCYRPIVTLLLYILSHACV